MNRFFKLQGYLISSAILITSLHLAPKVLAANCTPPPQGIVAWWQGEGNAMDTIGGGYGFLEPGTSFAPGMVGQCFSFDGVNGCVMNTNTPPLTNITNSFTIEFWAYPTQGFLMQPEGGGWGIAGQSYAVFPEYGDQTGGAGAGVSVGTNGVSVLEHAAGYLPSLLSYTNPIFGWTHIAVVYANKQPTLYVNGVNVRTGLTSTEAFVFPGKNLGSSYGSSEGHSYTTYGPYQGLLDEVSIYDRALGADEIAAIYHAGGAGKCFTPTPPVITSQPVSLTNFLGTTAQFSVTAIGSGPLTYQWSLGATSLPGATNATLTLTNLQYSQAGDYAVAISNAAGTTNSVAVSLAVNPVPPCVPAPAGVVGWWPGQDNAYDLMSGTTGILEPGTSFAPGMVGQCFSFDGVNGCVMNTGTPPLTYITNSFTIEFWANPSQGFIFQPEGGGLGNYGQSFAVFPEFGADTGGAGAGVSVGTNGVSVLEHAPDYLPSLLSYTNPIIGWTHIAVVYSNKQHTLYVNGVNVRTGLTSSQAFVFPGKNLGSSYDSFEGYAFSSYGPYKGLLDEVSIYDRALSATEVSAIYAAGSGGKCFTLSPPLITTQPVNSTNLLGSTATFSVAASGSAPVNFQWSFNGTNLNGATSATLTLSDVQLSQSGNYSVLVSNAAGFTNSATVSLTVYALPPTITAQPASAAYALGSTASFQVSATGTAPLNYQWSLNGTNLISATNATLILPNVQFSQAGSYSVQIANAAGSTNSVSASLVVYALPPFILAQPASQRITAGLSASFSVVATGTAPLRYQWSFNHSILPGATNATLTLSSVQTNQAGVYAVQVANLAGLTNSLPATLIVNPAPLCDAAPSGIVGWWQAEGNALDSISGSYGVIKPGSTFSNGVVGQCFSFDGVNGCVMTTNTPTLTSITNSFTIEFWAYPTKGVVFQPEGGGWGISGQSYAVFPEYGDETGGAGAGVSVGTNGVSVFEHAANYMPSLLSYTNPIIGWTHIAVVYTNKQPTLFVNGVRVRTGLTSSEAFVFPGKNLGSSYGSSSGVQYIYYGPYRGLLDEVSIYNRSLGAGEIAAIYNAGSAGKCPAPPMITSQPASQTNAVGSTATFGVGVGGAGPFLYQWSFDGTNIIAATNATLSLTNLQLSQAGDYTVLVSNGDAATNSLSAILTVVIPPTVSQQPQSQTVLSYGSATFNVAATGTGPLSYQWQKNGTNLVDNANVVGSTTSNLLLVSVGPADAGTYSVVVSSPYATTNSATATLTVPETVVSLGSASALSGSTITVPVTMNALGVENTFLASVGYDPTKLALQSVQLGQAIPGAYLQEVDLQTNHGYVGFAILLNTGSTIPAGTQEVADLVFQTLPVTNNTTVNLTFGDVPTGRQLVDNNLDSLPAIYLSGSITLSPAEYEADVYPRTNGDSQVNIFDWLEVGRMVAGLDVPTNSDEFHRADCSPRNAPDGVLTVADWVQAGRYALGLDPLTLVTSPAIPNAVAKAKPHGSQAPARILQVANVSTQRGQTVNVPVQLVCVTNENAVGLTLSYPTNQLRLLNVTLGSAFSAGRLNINSNRLAGKIGLTLALSPGAKLVAGTNQLVLLQFAASTNTSGAVAVSLDSSIVQLEVADLLANSLPATYVNGAVTLPPPPSVAATGTGGKLQLSWPLASGTFQILTSGNPAGPWNPITLPLVTNGANVGATVTPTNQQQYYRLQGQ